MARPTFVIVGAGMCGGAAAQTLREEGFDGRVILVGAESHFPYERPPLSKEYLRGEQGREKLFVHPESWFAEQDVEARLGIRATDIDLSARTVTQSDGDHLSYDVLLIATGGRPRRLGGEPSDRVLYLRTIEEADRIRERLSPGGRLVVVGAGFIGAEVAASARTIGADVTVLEMLDVPLAKVLGDDLGKVYAAIHRDEGVDLRTGEGVDSIEEQGGSVVVRTTKGDAVEGDAVVVGVGIQPNTELADAAGLELTNGIAVDEYCRTSHAGVFAAGDVADHFHPVFGRRIRVEHFDNAIKHGAHAARNMVGRAEVFDDPHWFWSDQYDYNLQYGGFAHEWDDVVVRGSLEERDFVAFFLKDGVLLAAVGINRGREVRRAMKLISARARPDPAKLRDADVDLRSLLPR
ncbi:MAG TPA: FAD-dependent oxidoreductase [Actinomycetota bacterium]|nr:FAD-dependent oxidoreductase [Actinomycetota bacterium]